MLEHRYSRLVEQSVFPVGRWLLLTLWLTLAPTRPAHGEPPRAVRTDRYGDPLPEGVLARLGTARLYQSGLEYLALSPDGKVVAAVGRDGMMEGALRLWRVDTGAELWRQALAPHLHEGNWPHRSPLRFSPDGKLLALAAGPKDAIRLWNTANGRELPQLPTKLGAVAIAFDPNGEYLALSDGRGTIQVWDLATAKLRSEWEDGASDLAYTADGKQLVVVKEAPDDWRKLTFTVRDVATGEVSARARHDEDSGAGFLAPGGKYFTAPTTDGKAIRLLDPGSGKELSRTQGEADSPWCQAFSADGRTLVAGCRDGSVRVWEAPGGKLLHQFRGSARSIHRMALSADGTVLALYQGRADEAVHLWDVPRARELHAFGGHRAGPLAVAFTADGKRVVTANRDFQLSGDVRDWADWSIRLWDPDTGRELHVTVGQQAGAVKIAAFSPDASLLATVTYDGAPLRLWEVGTGKELRSWKVPIFEQTVRSITKSETRVEKEPRPAILDLAFTGDGKTLYAAHGPVISRWEVATGKELPSLEVPGNDGMSWCLPGPDGRTVLLWREGGRSRLLLLDATSGRILWEKARADAAGYVYAFSPDGKTLAAASFSSSAEVALWETVSGQGRGRLKGRAALVSALAFSPDGRILAVGGDRSEPLRLFNLATDGPGGGLEADLRRVTALSFSPDVKKLAVAGYDNTALVCEVAGLLREPLPAAVQRAPRELEGLWDDLSGTDGARAYQAIQRLAVSGPEVVPFLKQCLKERPERDERRLKRLIGELDDQEFAVREQATRELESLGVKAEPALRGALQGNPSAEVRRRAERLLEKLGPAETPPPSAELVSLRVLEALEISGTPAARDAITELAKGAPEARLTQEAKASLERLARRPPEKP